jgi:hypothetical protein
VGPCAFSHDAVAQTKDLSRAREKDKEGAKAYGEGRYADAIRFFDEAYHLGGPPFELWNIAKCHLRLDQPEQAAEMLEKYLATPNLPKDDREEATQQLEQLKKRESKLTVTSSPSGANVSVDGKAVAGVTPLTLLVPAGPHTVQVSAPTGVPFTKQIDARYGRALTVDAPLKEGDLAPRPPPPANPYEKQADTIALRAAVALVIPKYGAVGGGTGIGGLFLGTYRIADIGKGGFSIGGLFSISGDHWKNETVARQDVGGKCVIPAKPSATAMSLYGIGAAAFPLSEKLKLGGIAGVGFTGLSHDELGADVFLASCNPSTGLRPAFLFGAELDYSIASIFRISIFPLTWHLQPAFDGTRGSPRDATGVWMRFEIGLGLGVDL